MLVVGKLFVYKHCFSMRYCGIITVIKGKKEM